VLDSPISFNTITQPVTYFFSNERFAQDVSGTMSGQNAVVGQAKDSVQKVKINVVSNGYEPNYFKVKVGVPVELTVSTNETYSCASTFLMKSFKIALQLAPTDSKTVTFTPTQKGKFPFNCSMGMYTGTMEVL
jgi:plastocyanin domain-containing protein